MLYSYNNSARGGYNSSPRELRHRRRSNSSHSLPGQECDPIMDLLGHHHEMGSFSEAFSVISITFPSIMCDMYSM